MALVDLGGRFILLYSLLFFLDTPFAAVTTTNPRVLIIGSGIGGSTCAYYINQFLPNASITVHEMAPSVGGRMRALVVDGVEIEVGAESWIVTDQGLSNISSVLEFGLNNGTFCGDCQVRHRVPLQNLECHAITFVLSSFSLFFPFMFFLLGSWQHL
jgi:hypothetical protein